MSRKWGHILTSDKLTERGGSVLDRVLHAWHPVLAVAMVAFASQPAFANLNQELGTSGGAFLKLGSGARAGAMADSFSAIADDVHAAYYNPAGLAQLKSAQISGAHNASFRGMNYEVFEFAFPFAKEEGFSRHTVGFGLYYLSVDRIEKRVGDTTDAVGTFTAADGAYGGSYAYGFNKHLSAGMNAKVVSSRIDTYHSNAFAVDFGALYRLNPGGTIPISLSGVLRNLGQRQGFAGRAAESPLPVSYTFGVGARALKDRVRANIEATKYRDTTLIGSAGGEYEHPVMDKVTATLRGGYTSHYKDLRGFNGAAMGVGLTFQRASFDFSWQPFGTLGNSYRYSLLVKF